MKFKYCLCFLLLAFFAKPIWAQKDKSEFKSRVEVVNVNLRVTNKSGDLITGLEAEDFEVYEDGVKQNITNFSTVEGPITTILLIDYSKQSYLMSLYSQNEVWHGPIEFLKSLKDEDWTSILMYDRKVYAGNQDKENGIFQDFTQNKRELESTLSNILNSQPAWSESCLVDAIKTVLDLVSENRESLTDKVSLILISTGLDTFSQNQYDKVLKEAQNSGVSIYAVSIGQQIRTLQDQYMDSLERMELSMSDNRLRSFAELTGGEVFLPKFAGEFKSIFQNISDDLRNQYSLGYISGNTKRDGKFRKIEIKVKKMLPDPKGKMQKLTARHRKGYYSPKD
ncbi:MAG TPA: VWA domain-containing protein [Candidatus Paceibacterota bacterium]